MTQEEKRQLKNCSVATVLTSFVLVPLIWAAVTTDPVIAKVIAKNWHRAINIEQLKTFRREGTWVPTGGRVLRSWTEYYTTFKRETSTTGTGKNKKTTSKTVPVIKSRTKYEYDIDEWCFTRNITTAGEANSPFWPNLSSLCTGNSVGCERPALQTQKYCIAVENLPTETTKFNRSVDLDLTLWANLPVNCIIVLEVNKLGGVNNIVPLESP